jgi:3-hexulose-6-phosphate synthase
VSMGRLIRRINELRRPLLQVALDFISINDALKIIKKLRGLDVDIYEVGTPLIKSEGVKAVGIVRELVDESVVLADMKTADVGALEVRLAAENGADAVSVLASADDEVITSALNEGRSLDVDVVVDTIGKVDVVKSFNDLVRLGVQVVNIHLAIDVQLCSGKTVADILDIIKYLRSMYTDVIISASGGVKPHHVKDLVRSGVNIVVMGSAITKASDPAKIVKDVLKDLSSP